MVGTAGIEPATPAMSTQCSPAELRAPPDTGFGVVGGSPSPVFHLRHGRVIHPTPANGKRRTRQIHKRYRLYSIS
jgi:hypothetical protein